jgi:uncharacterized membrane protein
MPNLTIAYGIVLILTGIVSWVGTGQESMTSLLPTIAGIPIAIAGMVAVNPQRRRLGLYIAAGLVAILALGTLRGVGILLGGDASTASIINTVLFVLSVGYLAVFVYRLRISSSDRDLA